MWGIKFHPVGLIIGVAAAILFICSSVRHALFQSNAWDLGIFDQAVYLISQGQSPISSFLDFHILGDHAALILYPLALLYKIHPDVHWLLAVQAVALALGALPTWRLALQAGLKASQAVAIAFVYLLYPLVFNLNLFDFHPEVIALPAIFWAVLAARQPHLLQFWVAIALILSCKAVLALTVAAMGVWLLIFERRLYGAIALSAGVAWFVVATGFIIPAFGDQSATIARHLSRYGHLGDSFSEIAASVVLNPEKLLKAVFTLPNLEYLAWLLLPVIWGLSPKHLAPLVGATPALAMNLLSDTYTQKNLTTQYSLPILPFLILAVISTLARTRGCRFPAAHGLSVANKGWLQRRGIILWSLIAFVALAKVGYFWSRYLETVDTWQATRSAVALVNRGSVLTTSPIAPHLTHRSVVQLATAESIDLSQFKYILLDRHHSGWASSPEIVTSLVGRLEQMPEFQLRYQQDGVFLFDQ